MNRGSDVSQLHGNSVAYCFNEAPIHESGKSEIANAREGDEARLQ